MVDSFLKTLNISRESCGLFDGYKKFDAAAVCHEVRCIDLSPGEQICVTFSVAGHRVAGGTRGPEAFSIGSVCHLRSLQLDAVIIVKVWAAFNSPSDGHSPSHGPMEERRVCGEARIPLLHIASSIYHTWINLESAGLNDTIGLNGYTMGSGSAIDSADAFSQAVMNGPRQLFQPKACISLCRVEELSPDGQILWSADFPRQMRVKCWESLLRSQQQHAVMCTAQHLQGSQLRNGQGEVPQRLVHLKAQAQEQAAEIESLQEQIQSLGSRSQTTTAPTSAEALDAMLKGGLPGDDWRAQPSMSLLEERTQRQLQEARGMAEFVEAGAARRGRQAEALKELENQRAVMRELEAALSNGQAELSKVGEEANNKIEAANARIKALKVERDKAVAAIADRKAKNEQVLKNIQEMEEEKDQLQEQKEALIRIVQDLHDVCLSPTAPSQRGSLDSITGFRLPN
eukprot:TRINITY_DN36413_c0_g1_i1.p1 TRINITY_DN36413_c0_g1~~TRINITY_DN36413_c0_g1_i1.p1  ORF type:complete len:457 (-),score=100.10 TRINITY_DN36413_c0_g1_i1:44-1414(-)